MSQQNGVFLLNDRVVSEEWTSDDPEDPDREIETWYVARFIGVSGSNGGDTVHFRVQRKVSYKRKPKNFSAPDFTRIVAPNLNKPDEWNLCVPLIAVGDKTVATIAWRCGDDEMRQVTYAIAEGTALVAAQTAAGNDPRRNATMNRARGEAISEGHRRNRSWAREHPGQRDEAWFKREIAPKLDAFTLAEIAAATGLSLAACSRIRAGARVPQPRHWSGLLALVEAGN
jgi:hypothetical protein